MLPLSSRHRALLNEPTEIIMRKLLGLMLLSLTVTTTAPAFANSYTDCSKAPKAEWAQCVFDQAVEHDG